MLAAHRDHPPPEPAPTQTTRKDIKNRVKGPNVLTAKCKQKIVTVEKNRDKRAKFYKKKHFSDLKKEVKALKSVVKNQAAQIQAKMKKIKSLESKN